MLTVVGLKKVQGGIDKLAQRDDAEVNKILRQAKVDIGKLIESREMKTTVKVQH